MRIAWYPKTVVGYLYVSRSEKSNRTNFYWVKILMYITWEYQNISICDIVQKSLWILNHFDKVQIICLFGFLGHLLENTYLKIFKTI